MRRQRPPINLRLSVYGKKIAPINIESVKRRGARGGQIRQNGGKMWESVRYVATAAIYSK